MTISKKNGKYYCRFQINGERHHYLCDGATTKQQAEQIENGFKYKLQQQQNGVISKEEDKDRVKLKKLRKNFLEYSEIHRAVYKQDVGRLNIAFKFFDENRYADTVTLTDVNKFKAWLLSLNKSKKTVNLYLGIFRVMYNLAIEDDLLVKNPFRKKFEFKLDPVKRKYLADTSQTNLTDATPDYFKPIITTALNTGLRRGNIVNLKWSDLDFNFKTIEITKNKGKKHIKLPMNDTMCELFSKMERKSEFIFLNPNTGKKWANTAFNKLWRNIRDKAGLADFKFHGLRHTVCTRLIKKNVPLPIVKEVMTHSSISTTMEYTHVDSLDVVNAISLLNSYN